MNYEIEKGNDMNIGKKIVSIRKEKGLTQKELANKMGVSQQMINQYEKSDNLNLNTIRKIAQALDIDYLELLEKKLKKQIKNICFEKGDLVVNIKKDDSGNIIDVELGVFKKYDKTHTCGCIYFEFGNSSGYVPLENLYPVSNKDKFLLGAKI